MSSVRTFRAASMQEALQLVRRELGGDAVILQTRQVAQKRLLPWTKVREEVEVTAGRGAEVRPAVPRRSSNRSNTVESAVGAIGVRPDSEVAGLPPSSVRSVGRSLSGPGNSEQPLRSHPNGVDGEVRGTAQQLASRESLSTDELAAKLDAMQKMIEELSRSGQMHRREEIPDELFHLYTDLIDADVEEDLARELIFRLKKDATAEQLRDAAASRSMIQSMVQSELDCQGPIQLTPGRRKVVALVGPTGVGKTTTIAKLAANFRIRDGIRMGLVTVDTYRIAAVEQLRTYAEIIDLPMKVVTSPQEMRRALDELTGLDLVLIDTAGRSPRDDLKIQELKSLLAEADVDEVQLVLSMTAGLKSLLSTAENFAAANTTSVILTKLDEAAGMGALLSVARRIGLPISYLTTGQAVPEDIEPAESARVARLILGQDSAL